MCGHSDQSLGDDASQDPLLRGHQNFQRPSTPRGRYNPMRHFASSSFLWTLILRLPVQAVLLQSVSTGRPFATCLFLHLSLPHTFFVDLVFPSAQTTLVARHALYQPFPFVLTLPHVPRRSRHAAALPAQCQTIPSDDVKWSPSVFATIGDSHKKKLAKTKDSALTHQTAPTTSCTSQASPDYTT